MISRVQSLWESIWFARRRPVVVGLGPESLQLPDEKLAWTAYCQVGQALDEAKGFRNSKLHMLPPQWRLVYSLTNLDSEVRNGGFHQFFTNARGKFDPFLEADLLSLHETPFHPLIKSAICIYRRLDYTRQWANIGKSWEVFADGYKDKSFDHLESVYYKIRPQLGAQIGAHIRSKFELYRSA